MTLILKISNSKPENSKIEQAASFIKQGKLVAFPTETVYGLGADALNENAIEKIFQIKKRTSKKGLLLHIANKKDIYKFSKEVPKLAETLIKKFWPGPLTLVLKKSSKVPSITTGNQNTVGFRMPANKIALELIKASKTPIAAPSANISGLNPPTTAKEVIKNFDHKISCIIDGGPTKFKLPSTIVDLTSSKPKILRQGAIKSTELSF